MKTSSMLGLGILGAVGFLYLNKSSPTEQLGGGSGSGSQLFAVGTSEVTATKKEGASSDVPISSYNLPNVIINESNEITTKKDVAVSGAGATSSAKDNFYSALGMQGQSTPFGVVYSPISTATPTPTTKKDVAVSQTPVLLPVTTNPISGIIAIGNYAVSKIGGLFK